MSRIHTSFESFNESFGGMVKPDEKVITIDSLDQIKDTIDKTGKYKFGDYLITVNGEKLTAMIAKESSKSRFGIKIVQNYRYASMKRIQEAMFDFFENIEKNKKYKEDKKQEKKEKKKDVVDVLKVGDLMYDSWGYEQTNIDFYQVTKVSDTGTVWIRPIDGESVKGKSAGNSMAGYVKPVKDAFTGDEIRKTANFYGNNVYLNSKHGSISKYTDGDEGVYTSWYA